MLDVIKLAPINDVDAELARINNIRIKLKSFINNKNEGQNIGFVISWFFPPTTAVRGLASFRLLKSSRSKHFVQFSLSNGNEIKNYSYGENVIPLPYKIDEYPYRDFQLSDWYNQALENYETLNLKYGLDYIMTNSVPIPDHNIGLEIKRRDPLMKWVAFFSDPMSNNDHSTFYKRSKILQEKNVKNWEQVLHNEKLKMREYEISIYEKADLLLFPQETLARFMMGDLYVHYKHKIGIVPHSFDNYVEYDYKKEQDKITMAFVGSLYALQSINELSAAIKFLKKISPDLHNKLNISIVGNVEQSNRETVLKDDVSDVINFTGEVDHEQSLDYMRKSDYLLSLQPMIKGQWLGFIKPAKLADYMSTKKPILLFGDANSESEIFARNSKNIFCPQDPQIMAYLIKSILEGRVQRGEIDINYYNKFQGSAVSLQFDQMVTNVINGG